MAAFTRKSTVPAQKLCVACKERIPADATVCFHCQTRQVPEKESESKRLLGWIGVVTAVIGLITGLSGVVGPLKGWWKQGHQSHALLTTALRQSELAEYSASMDTLAEILKASPEDKQALHTQLDVAMLWIESIRTPRHGVDEVAPQAHSIFDRLTPILESGLGSAKDYRAADVVAHLGWLNLLKWRITGQDGIIESHFREALQMDPENVFANAMMGEWILLTHGSLEEAKTDFATSLKSGKAKTFVRGCQLEGMIYDNDAGVPAELIRVANQMRKDKDPISDGDRGRILGYFSSTIATDAELRDVISAVPPDEMRATYEWLRPPDPQESDFSKMERRFIEANIDEVSGRREEALQIYRSMEIETRNSNLHIAQRVRDRVRRLSH